MNLKEAIKFEKGQLKVICGKYLPYAAAKMNDPVHQVTPEDLYTQPSTGHVVLLPEGFTKVCTDGTIINNDYPSMVKLGELIVSKHTGLVLTNNVPLIDSIELHSSKFNRPVLFLQLVDKDEAVDITKNQEAFYKVQCEGIRLLDSMRGMLDDEEI